MKRDFEARRVHGVVLVLVLALVGCSDTEEPRPNGATCTSPGQCVSSLCHSATCLDPAADDDRDGLINEIEFMLKTSATNADTDGDGIDDYTEVVDPLNPTDSDGDSVIDALESAHIDSDCNLLSDQYDDPDKLDEGEDPDALQTPCPASVQAKLGDDICCPDLDNDGVADIIDCDPGDPTVAFPDDCPQNNGCFDYECKLGFHCVADPTCSSDEPCTTATCDEEDMACVIVAADQSCDDGNDCTLDSCVDESCVHVAILVEDDGLDCTTDTCDPVTGAFSHVAHHGLCDDENACTEDSCDPVSGCSYEFDASLCPPPAECAKDQDCDDKNECTTDSCDAELGCVLTANDLACDDEDGCTVGDQCANSVCISGEPQDCDDDDPCTIDSCDPATGACESTKDESLCPPDPCESLQCGDGTPCTTHTCDAQGCHDEIVAGVCGSDLVCDSLAGCKDGCVDAQVFTAADGFLSDHGWTSESGSSTCAKASCEIPPEDWSSSDGALLLEMTSLFQTDGALEVSVLDASNTPVYIFTLTMEAGVSAAQIESLVSLLDESQYDSLDVIDVLPVPNVWFSFALGVGTDGKFHFILAAGEDQTTDGWLGWPGEAKVGGGPPYSFTVTVDTGHVMGALSVRTNVDSCCATSADCDDQNPCTEDLCVDEFCVTDDLGCDDQNPCTQDICADAGCESVVVDASFSIADQQAAIAGGCVDLGCTPIVGAAEEEVQTYCQSACSTIANCQVASDDLDAEGTLQASFEIAKEACVDLCVPQISSNILAASHVSCRVALADSQGACTEEDAALIADTCGDPDCPVPPGESCEALCVDLDGCGFSDAPTPPEEFDVLWGPPGLCDSSCTGFGLGAYDTDAIAVCISTVMTSKDCDFALAGQCTQPQECDALCDSIFGNESCHEGTPIAVQLGGQAGCEETCGALSEAGLQRLHGCVALKGCGFLPPECLDENPGPDLELITQCQDQCAAAFLVCGILPPISSVERCRGLCEGFGIVADGLLPGADLSQAFSDAGCPAGEAQFRTLVFALVGAPAVCSEVCGSSAALACDEVEPDTDLCLLDCTLDFHEEPQGFGEKGACTSALAVCGEAPADPCGCAGQCLPESAAQVICPDYCAVALEAGVFAVEAECLQSCAQEIDELPNAISHFACWITAPSPALAADRCDSSQDSTAISQGCVDACMSDPISPSPICSNGHGYLCALVCEGAQRWSSNVEPQVVADCVLGIVGESCDLSSVADQCGLLACGEAPCVGGSACSVGACDPLLGVCTETAAPDGTPCNDGNLCSDNPTCQAGVCDGGPKTCLNLLGPCNNAICNPETGDCEDIPHDSDEPCDDGVPCTVGDHCDGAGECEGGPTDPCDDDVECTADSCSNESGCQHVLQDQECDDGVGCTEDLCKSDGCKHLKTDSLCDDENVCTEEACDVVGGCQSKVIVCSDGNLCTFDSCDPVQGCTSVEIECEDDIDCTLSSCDVGTGACSHTPSDGDCDDTIGCTVDTCQAGIGCTHAADDSLCEDGDACTTDSCDSFVDCEFFPIEECGTIGGPGFVCPDGEPPLTEIAVLLVNPGAEFGVTGWDVSPPLGGPPDLATVGGVLPCAGLPEPIEGDAYFTLGDPCPEAFETGADKLASQDATLSPAAAAIFLGGNGALAARAQAGTLTTSTNVTLTLRLEEQGGFPIPEQPFGDGIPLAYTLGSWSEIGGVLPVSFLPSLVTLGLEATGTNPPVSGYIDDVELFVLDCPQGP